MRLLVALASGALFGLGLIVSDMVNPGRVLGFLDIAGAWDPTLAFVMAGALIPMAIAWRIAGGRAAPACGGSFPAGPARTSFRVVAGAVLFGLGWGLVGFCPGPALVAVGTGNGVAATFVLAMVIGMWVQTVLLPHPKDT